MAKARTELQNLLEGLLGSRNVYFQPPENFKLNYPCIVYELSDIRNWHADNRVYTQKTAYRITVIDKNPDSSGMKAASLIPGVRFDRHYKADNLNHWVFVIYY